MYITPSGVVPISGGVEDVDVGEGVAVSVAVWVMVGVDVDADEVGDGVNVGVAVAAVGGGLVLVRLRFGVEVGLEGIKTKVLVGLLVIPMVEVAVAEEAGIWVGGSVDVVGGKGVPVMIDTPGVRKLLQPGCVRMEASTGSMNPLGMWVR
jgi:hypothetical protein